MNSVHIVMFCLCYVLIHIICSYAVKMQLSFFYSFKAFRLCFLCNVYSCFIFMFDIENNPPPLLRSKQLYSAFFSFLVHCLRSIRAYVVTLPSIMTVGWLPCGQRIIASSFTVCLMIVGFLRWAFEAVT